MGHGPGEVAPREGYGEACHGEHAILPRPLHHCSRVEVGQPEEGVVQVLRDLDAPTASPVLGAVGQMQFEVFSHRLEHEFGAKVEMNPTSWVVARRTNEETANKIRELRGTRVLGSLDGTLFALFDSTGRLMRTTNDNPEWVLERVVETAG